MAKIQVEVEQIANKLKEMFIPHINFEDIGMHEGENLDNHQITRSLAAYAVYWKNGCSLSAAGNSVTDGTGDNGIDAIYFNTNSKRLTIVQSKYIKDGNSEPDAEELRTFRDGINDLIESNIESFNQKVQYKRDEINKIKEFGTKIDLILVYTSKETLAEPATRVINKMMEDLNGGDDDDDGVFSFHPLHKKRIITSLTHAMGGNEIKLEFLLKDYGFIKEPLLSYYGKINGVKLKEWWESHSDLLFRDNIRNTLGITPVNTILEKTVNEQPELFWFFNNGITVIADKIEKTPENGSNRDYGYFKAENASVVNGAQTYSTIGKCGIKGIDIEKIEVPFRVIQVNKTNKDIRQEITRYNNTQNTILPKDFLSQDSIQLSLQEKLSLSGYKYIIKRDADFNASDKDFDFDEATESLIAASSFPNQAATFKKEISRFYNTESTLYKSIFNPTTNAYRVINAVLIHRDFKRNLIQATTNLIEKETGLDKIQSISNSGNIVIAQCLFKNSDTGKKSTLDKKECTLSYSVTEIEETLERIVRFINDEYPAKYIVTLFQNVEKVKTIYDAV